jgi:hypothetical protein
MRLIIIRSDAILFEFLVQYLQRLEGPVAVQVWGRFLQLAKEVISATRDFKSLNFPVLRLVTHDDCWYTLFSSVLQMSLCASRQNHTNNGYGRQAHAKRTAGVSLYCAWCNIADFCSNFRKHLGNYSMLVSPSLAAHLRRHGYVVFLKIL